MRDIVIWLIVVFVATIILAQIGIVNISIDSFWVGYLSSIAVIAASAYSFFNMVKSKAGTPQDPAFYERDPIDKIEDPYMLYDDEDSTEELSLKEQKKLYKAQKPTTSQALKSSTASLSVYRLLAYGLLVLGFFYLRDNNLFTPISYIIGLTLPVMVVVTVLFIQRGRS